MRVKVVPLQNTKHGRKCKHVTEYRHQPPLLQHYHIYRDAPDNGQHLIQLRGYKKLKKNTTLSLMNFHMVLEWGSTQRQ